LITVDERLLDKSIVDLGNTLNDPNVPETTYRSISSLYRTLTGIRNHTLSRNEYWTEIQYLAWLKNAGSFTFEELLELHDFLNIPDQVLDNSDYVEEALENFILNPLSDDSGKSIIKGIAFECMKMDVKESISMIPIEKLYKG